MNWHLGRMCPLDTETTGTNPETARIVEAYIGQVGGDQAPVDPAPILIDPGVEVPAEAAKVHGVDAMVLGEERDELAEGGPRLRKAVHEKNRRAGRSGCDVVQHRVVHLHRRVVQVGRGWGAGGHVVSWRFDWTTRLTQLVLIDNLIVDLIAFRHVSEWC